eukprot:CAMPEP_0179034018 /NCGR_PEP_ID=MMETSP0796-20121207/12396_1 /TAXON_ID=73915 /ORGANISM="Pyrodinium bahamense, Strain pbaha01" /LENGTH=143 /DNA_ID=CAMNT_0020730281 /DNA_START=328 /DNA_END=757 /DNA_ORIENTATION=+
MTNNANGPAEIRESRSRFPGELAPALRLVCFEEMAAPTVGASGDDQLAPKVLQLSSNVNHVVGEVLRRRKIVDMEECVVGSKPAVILPRHAAQGKGDHATHDAPPELLCDVAIAPAVFECRVKAVLREQLPIARVRLISSGTW